MCCLSLIQHLKYCTVHIYSVLFDTCYICEKIIKSFYKRNTFLILKPNLECIMFIEYN